MGCNTRCALHLEFEISHERLTYCNHVLDWLQHIRFSELDLLDFAGHENYNEEIEQVEREIRRIERIINKICQVLNDGRFICVECGTIFI